MGEDKRGGERKRGKWRKIHRLTKTILLEKKSIQWFLGKLGIDVPLGYIPKGCSSQPHRYLLSHVHCGFVPKM